MGKGISGLPINRTSDRSGVPRLWGVARSGLSEDTGCGESTSKGMAFFCVCMSVCIYYVNMNLSEYAFHEPMSVICVT